MELRVRDYAAVDVEAVVTLSLRAWAPVFASTEELLGPELFGRLRGDWRVSQEAAVRDVLADPVQRVWVAESQGPPIGFVAATLHDDGLLGEVSMLAVDPRAQNRGVGMALTMTATDWLRASGMRVAMIDTGGDPGHAPARRVYEKAAYVALPVVRYVKAL